MKVKPCIDPQDGGQGWILISLGFMSGIVTISKELNVTLPEAEFKEFEPRLKFKPRLKYSWIHLKSYLMFQDLSRRRSIETGFWGV